MRTHINVANCVAYLRSIGVEIHGAQATAWDTTERVHRFLQSTRRIVRQGRDMTCRHGHDWFDVFVQPARSKADKQANAHAATCPECGETWCRSSARWRQARDGTVHDHRPRDERWKPMQGL